MTSTPIAQMVLEMIKRGVDPDVIALAVSTAEIIATPADVRGQSADVSADRRREKDRIRKQMDRENLRKSAESADNPQTSESASLSKESKKEGIKEEVGERKRAVRGHRLPDDWAPTAIDHAIALEMLGPDRARSELEKFRDHWKQQSGSKGVKLDWDAAWRNWIRRSAEYRGGTNGHRSHNASNKPAGGSFLDGLRSLAEDIAGDPAAPGPAGAEIPRGRFEIDG